MKRELIQKPINNQDPFSYKLKTNISNLANKFITKIHRYEFESLQEFYENNEGIEYSEPIYMYNLMVEALKGNELEKIITLRDHSRNLDFKSIRLWNKPKEIATKWGYIPNPEYFISMNEDEWKRLETLKPSDIVNIQSCYLDNTPYISDIRKHKKENREKLIIPDYPSQLLEKVIK